MILQRTRPPLLETPFDVFDRGVFTPNDRFFVRWHWAASRPTRPGHLPRSACTGQSTSRSADPGGHLAMPRVELAAVNQCSGNSRGFFAAPGRRRRVGQRRHGQRQVDWASACVTCWTGQASTRRATGALRWAGRAVGARRAQVPEIPRYRPRQGRRGHARLRDERRPVAIAERLPAPADRAGLVFDLLGQDARRHRGAGRPGRELLDEDRLHHPGHARRQREARRNRREAGPDQPHGPPLVPHQPDRRRPRRSPGPTPVRGIAMGGATGVRMVEVSGDGGTTWRRPRAGRATRARYSFRAWTASLDCQRAMAPSWSGAPTRTAWRSPRQPNWNPSGFMRNVIETTRL